MNQIEKLIAELCPEGVEWVAIGDVANCFSGATPKSEVVAYWDNGVIPWMSSGEVNKGTVWDTDKKITQAGFDSCSTKMVPPGTVVIALAGQGKTRGMVARLRISVCTNQSLCSVICAENLDSDFLYYFLKTQYRQLRDVSSGDGTRGGLNLKMIREYQIPLPPLTIQQKIVDILDKFTALEAELEAELEGRKKQYEFYRNSLLTFEKGVPHFSQKIETLIQQFCPEGVEWRMLGDVTTYSDTRVDAITLSDDSFVGVDNLLPNKGGKSIAKYLPNTARLTAYEKGDILLGNIRPYLKKIWFADSAGGCSGDVLAIRILQFFRSKIRPEYLHYLLSSDSFFAYNMQHAKGAKMPRGSKSAILEYQIPVPPLEIQQEIVAILDKFDTLVNDISIGLPAEIAARRKQYEYYREKLLTFKRKEV